MSEKKNQCLFLPWYRCQCIILYYKEHLFDMFFSITNNYITCHVLNLISIIGMDKSAWT